MLTRIDQNNVSWVDVQSPNPEEILKLSKEFSLPLIVASELSRPSFHPKAESHGEHLYLIFHLPLYDHRLQYHHSRELDIVVGQKFLLTIHYEPIEPLSNLFSELELNLGIRKELFNQTSQKLLYQLWSKTYNHLLQELDHIQKKIDIIEDRIFSDERKDFIEEMSLLRRDVLDFSRSIRPHGMLMEEFSPIARAIFGPEFIRNIKELSQNYRRLMALVENDKDALEVLYDTYNAILTRRSSETTKIFTMLALLTFPLTLFAAIFAIETVSRPIVGRPHDFWILIGIMVVIVVGMLFFFKHKKWIN